MKFKSLFEDWEVHDNDKFAHEILTHHGLQLKSSTGVDHHHGYSEYYPPEGHQPDENQLMRDLKSSGWEHRYTDHEYGMHTLTRQDPDQSRMEMGSAQMDVRATRHGTIHRVTHYPRKDLK